MKLLRILVPLATVFALWSLPVSASCNAPSPGEFLSSSLSWWPFALLSVVVPTAIIECILMLLLPLTILSATLFVLFRCAHLDKKCAREASTVFLLAAIVGFLVLLFPPHLPVSVHNLCRVSIPYPWNAYISLVGGVVSCVIYLQRKEEACCQCIY